MPLLLGRPRVLPTPLLLRVSISLAPLVIATLTCSLLYTCCATHPRTLSVLLVPMSLCPFLDAITCCTTSRVNGIRAVLVAFCPALSLIICSLSPLLLALLTFSLAMNRALVLIFSINEYFYSHALLIPFFSV